LWTLRISVAVLAILLAGCRIEPITPTPEASQTQTPTVPLPLESLLPTLETTPTLPPPETLTPTQTGLLPPEAGEILFRDELDANRSGWPLTGGSAGSIYFANEMLSFTVRDPFTSLFSIVPKTFPDNLYVEATATTTFCGSKEDTFGILFRAQAGKYYRYAVTCNGLVRLEKFTEGGMNANAWQEVPALLRGAPAENRIGVLLRGREFRFYVAGIEVYAASEPVIPSGGLGLFVRTGKGSLLTVSFSDLTVYALKPE
jgi:hypothetical protein